MGKSSEEIKEILDLLEIQYPDAAWRGKGIIKRNLEILEED